MINLDRRLDERRLTEIIRRINCGPHQECLPPLPHEKSDNCSCREIARAILAALSWEMAEALRLHIQLLLSKWMLTLERHRSELDEIEREMIEYAARLNQPQLPIEQEPVE